MLREYRTRLISDVVTGKLDVRGVELPDLPAEELLDELQDEPDEDSDEAGNIEETEEMESVK